MDSYENISLLKLPDRALRPGGFELTRQLVELAELGRGAKILDVGCGYGASAAYLTELGFKAQGIDKSAELIARGAALYPDITLTCANAEQLMFEKQSVDAVLMECSLSVFTPNAEKALIEARRVVKRGGVLLVSDVFAAGDDCGIMTSRICIRSRAEFGQILHECGLILTRFEDRTGVFESFIAQLIMSTGSIDVLFGCDEWSEIKKAKPRYGIATARRTDD